jgi:hypothetical protein
VEKGIESVEKLKMAYPEDKKRMKVFIRCHLYGKR